MTRLNYWKIVGFHFYHPAPSYKYDAIAINQCLHFQILDNYFDSVNPVHAAIASGTSGPGGSAPNYSSYGLIRSNKFYRVGLVAGGKLIPAVNINLVGTNNLVEYNDASVSDDFLRLFGRHNVIRNNYYHDTQYSWFSNQPHTDGMQTADSPGTYPGFDHNLWERNMMISNSNPNGHVYILQNASPSSVFPITDFTVRKNVALYTGGLIGLIDDVPNVRDYNNTWAVVGGAVDGRRQNDFCTEASVNYARKGTVLPTNFVGINNIYFEASDPVRGTIFGGPNESVFNRRPPMSSVISHNLTWRSGPSIPKSSGPDFIGRDPRFVSFAGLDVHLTSASPARLKARPQTITISAGVMTDVVAVADAGFFTDGWGIDDVAGDVVCVAETRARSSSTSTMI